MSETEIRGRMAARLKEERNRLGLGQLELATLGGTKLRTLQDWERAISPVQAEFLAAVHQHGVDVLYIVTGCRETPSTADALAPSQVEELQAFAGLGEEPRAAVLNLLQVIKNQ